MCRVGSRVRICPFSRALGRLAAVVVGGILGLATDRGVAAEASSNGSSAESSWSDFWVAADRPWRELAVGGDVVAGNWLIYSNTTVAPFGDLWSDGFRLRLSTSYGRYHYVGQRGRAALLTEFDGRVTSFDGLVGYQTHFGPLTAKAFVGVASIDHRITPDDTYASTGSKIGARGVVELWLDIGTFGWSSLDLNYATAHRTYSVRARQGMRVFTREVSVGVEAGLNGSTGYRDDGGATPFFDPQHRDVRFGGFVRYDAKWGEASVSGGLSTDLGERRDAYGTANLLLSY